ncbi:MAG: hypothetical protein ACD_68C00016G0001, partial [uncultured bacterium]
APIWHNFMVEATKELPIENFTAPLPEKVNKAVLQGKSANEKKVRICKSCGDKLANENCPANLVEEKTYLEVHNILYYVIKDNPRGDYPKKQTDPQYSAWEGPVQRWAEGQGYINEDPPTETCLLHEPDKQPSVSFTNLKEGDVITAASILIQANAEAPLGIQQVDFYVNGQLIHRDTSTPYQTDYTPSADLNSVPVKATVTDKVGNVVSQEIRVSFHPPSAQVLTVSLTSPSSAVALTSSDFPYTLTAHAESSAGLATVNFYLQKLDGETSLLGEVTLSQNKEIDASLTVAAPAMGSYRIFAKATDINGKNANSQSVAFTVSNE